MNWWWLYFFRGGAPGEFVAVVIAQGPSAAAAEAQARGMGIEADVEATAVELAGYLLPEAGMCNRLLRQDEALDVIWAAMH